MKVSLRCFLPVLLVLLFSPLAQAQGRTNGLAKNPGVSAPQPGSPLWLQQAYDLTSLSASAGMGQSVAIFINYNDKTLGTDLAGFRLANGLAPCGEADHCLRIINTTPTSSPLSASRGGDGTLDVDAISALCPHCHIVVLEDGAFNPYSDALVAKSAGATVFTFSIELKADSAGPAAGGDPASLNIPTTASSGDAGALGYPTAFDPATYGDVTATGGTTVAPDPTNPRGVDEWAWGGSGSYCDTYQPIPAYQVGTNTGCSGRAFSDLSADGDPSSGLSIYQSWSHSWASGGGTSLSAPLVAAYYALLQSRGIHDLTSPAWAYSHGNTLNKIRKYTPNSYSYPYPGGGTATVNGSFSPSSACSTISSTPLCSPRASGAWSGPTGMGSISGDILRGKPAVGSNGDTLRAGTTSLRLFGGVYSNGNATRVHIQYGLTSAYGLASATVRIPATMGARGVRFTLSHLMAHRIYHYRLVAVNGDGVSYGYDQTAITA